MIFPHRFFAFNGVRIEPPVNLPVIEALLNSGTQNPEGAWRPTPLPPCARLISPCAPQRASLPLPC